MSEEIEIDYGTSFKLDDTGALSFVGGDIEMIDGPDNVGQRIVIACTTELGEDQFNPDYGIDRFAIFGSDFGYDDTIAVFKEQLRRAILEDEQILAVHDITEEEMDYVNRIYSFTVNVELVGGESYIANVLGVRV